MDKFVIRGGRPLNGQIAVSGAKNSALPALAASLLTAEPVVLRRIPGVRDIRTMTNLIAATGASVSVDGETVAIRAANIERAEAPYELVKTMRASSLVLGPLVARCGRARVSMPGGCAIGARPINLHVHGLEQLGATIAQDHGYIEAQAAGGLVGRKVHFDRITVTGTEDLMMATTLARGTTVLSNAACEPEVVDLAILLNKMGALVEGAGTPTIRIEGVERLHGAEHEIIADRIEAGTFLCAGAMMGEGVTLKRVAPEHMKAVLDSLKQCGFPMEIGKDSITIHPNPNARGFDLTTLPYPGFPTDMQAQFCAMACAIPDTSTITETIFPQRFMHVAEMKRMGANIDLQGATARIRGVDKMKGAPVMASDLRASAALVLAAIKAEGKTEINRLYHIDRGYEHLDDKLSGLGANLERVKG